jgi:hypothetical protein
MRRLFTLILALTCFCIPSFAQTAFNAWTPKGNIVSGTDVGNPSVFYTTTGCIIIANPCFQMLYGNFSGTGSVLYQESTNGLTGWTTYTSNPVLTGVFDPIVWFVGGTYYLFGGPQNTSSVVEYTATSPIGPWTSQGTAISAGGTGAWDSQLVAQPNLLDIIGGTWYAYYSGTKVSGQLQGGLVTSSNGLPPWTKSASNPLITPLNGASAGGFTFTKVGGHYYGYGQCYYANAQIQANHLTSIMRWSSPSATGPWTQLAVGGIQVATYYATIPADFAETSGNIANNQLGDPNIVYVPSLGNTYMYYDVGTGGAEGAVNVAEAIGQTPTQLAAGYEGVVGAPISGAPQLNLVTTAFDPGTGSNANPIGGNWTQLSATAPYSAAQRASNVIEGDTVQNNHDSWWNAVSFPNDHWAQVVPSVTSASGFIGASTRENKTGTATSYKEQWGGQALGSSGTMQIVRLVSGTSTVLSTIISLTISTNDQLLQVVNGSMIYNYYDGILLWANSDTNITSGSAGFELYNAQVAANAAIASWSGGTFKAAPSLVIGSGKAEIF